MGIDDSMMCSSDSSKRSPSESDSHRTGASPRATTTSTMTTMAGIRIRQRPDRAQREPDREVVAHGHRLRDLYVTIGLRHAERAPVITLTLGRTKALAEARQRGFVRRVIDEAPRAIPDIDDDAIIRDAVQIMAASFGDIGCADVERQRQRHRTQFA